MEFQSIEEIMVRMHLKVTEEKLKRECWCGAENETAEKDPMDCVTCNCEENLENAKQRFLQRKAPRNEVKENSVKSKLAMVKANSTAYTLSIIIDALKSGASVTSYEVAMLNTNRNTDRKKFVEFIEIEKLNLIKSQQTNRKAQHEFERNNGWNQIDDWRVATARVEIATKRAEELVTELVKNIKLEFDQNGDVLGATWLNIFGLEKYDEEIF